MSITSPALPTAWETFLQEQGDRSLLRFITCGSVDDGKSTLIGRLLYESQRLYEDQLQALAQDSKKYGTQGDHLDFALLLDGLQAEREQGITIDVAYRYFSTDRRRFIVADTPGHTQYTRNMATGASTASLAVILVDARKGIVTQTKRHTRIVSWMGISHVVLAVNKMDAVGYRAAVFYDILDAYQNFVQAHCAFQELETIPLSALLGDNLLTVSQHMPWYKGPSLMNYLETVDVPERDQARRAEPFRMPVQWVNRPSADFRGFCGRVAAGSVYPGQPVTVMPSGQRTMIQAVWQGMSETALATVGQSVTLTLADELDVSRGDVLCDASVPTPVSNRFEARLIWMSEAPLIPGRAYLAKLHCKEVLATVMDIQHLEDINTGAHLAAKTLHLNDVGWVTLQLNQPVAFAPYDIDRQLGSLILMDRFTLETLGAGMLQAALPQANHVHWQTLEINQQARAALKAQTPYCIWFTGLSGAGKSTLANMLEKQLHAEGRHTYLLDGDNVRLGLNRDLGFTEADRVENIRRVAEVAKMMVDAGLIVLVSFISPFRAERQLARELFQPDEFMEVFVDTPLDECERRDPKGLYAKARAGEIKEFTGISAPYEEPLKPELRLRTDKLTVESCVARIVEKLARVARTRR